MVKPKILLIVDVKGWAWWHKAQYLKKYLSDEFDFVISDTLEKEHFDIYVTFGYSQVPLLASVPYEKRVTGVTAHRQFDKLSPILFACKWIHANSLLLYNALKHYFSEDRLFYVPNGVDEQLFKPETQLCRNNEIVFGYVCKKSQLKGWDLIKELPYHINNLNLYKHNNDFKTAIPLRAMPVIYNSFDVLLVASIEDGTPNPALEAAACGRPIISNRIGNMPEFIKNGYNGLLLDKISLQNYIHSIQYLKDNINLVKEMGQNARKTVEEAWTWRIMSENYRKMFKHIIGECL